MAISPKRVELTKKAMDLAAQLIEESEMDLLDVPEVRIGGTLTKERDGYVPSASVKLHVKIPPERLNDPAASRE